MKGRNSIRPALLSLALPLLLLRALTPEGYMPAAPGSGLLFELCPEGLSAEFVQVLSGHAHHHGHDDTDDSGSGAGTEQCPIGHMLGAAVATDGGPVDAADALTPASLQPANFSAPVATRPSFYRSRAPPA